MLIRLLLVVCVCAIMVTSFGNACHSDTCIRQEFHEITDKRPINPVVLIQRGPWPLKYCRRLCRQYLECLVFKVVWLNTDFGMCTIYRGMIKQANMVAETGSTIYTSCPADLVWDHVRDICHSPVLQSHQFVPDAEKICRSLFDYPGLAHPRIMTPRSPADTAWLNTFAAGMNVRLGIYRPPGGALNEFVYLDGGTEITWSYWSNGQPDGAPPGADYVVAYDGGGQGHKWFDNPHFKMRFVCEI